MVLYGLMICHPCGPHMDQNSMRGHCFPLSLWCPKHMGKVWLLQLPKLPNPIRLLVAFPAPSSLELNFRTKWVDFVILTLISPPVFFCPDKWMLNCSGPKKLYHSFWMLQLECNIYTAASDLGQRRSFVKQTSCLLFAIHLKVGSYSNSYWLPLPYFQVKSTNLILGSFILSPHKLPCWFIELFMKWKCGWD